MNQDRPHALRGPCDNCPSRSSRCSTSSMAKPSMPSEDDAPIINRFKASCTRLLNRFRWPALSATRWDCKRSTWPTSTQSKAARLASISIARSSRQDFTCGSMPAIRDLESLAPLLGLDRRSSTIVAGLETVEGPRELTEIVNQAGARPSHLQSRLVRGKTKNGGVGRLGDRRSRASWPKPRSTAACDTC